MNSIVTQNNSDVVIPHQFKIQVKDHEMFHLQTFQTKNKYEAQIISPKNSQNSQYADHNLLSKRSNEDNTVYRSPTKIKL